MFLSLLNSTVFVLSTPNTDSVKSVLFIKPSITNHILCPLTLHLDKEKKNGRNPVDLSSRTDRRAIHVLNLVLKIRSRKSNMIWTHMAQSEKQQISRGGKVKEGEETKAENRRADDGRQSHGNHDVRRDVEADKYMNHTKIHCI